MIIDKIRIGNTSYDIGVDYSNVDGTPTKLSDFTNDEGFIDKNVNNLTNYTPSSQTTSQLELVLNSENYKLKGILKDSTGSTIYTSNEIDLPLESVVVSGAYDSQTKEVVLTLVNGSTIRFSVADLVSGLVSSTDLATALANYYTKTETDTLLGGKQPSITSTNKLSADLVDDTNSTNKFVSASDKTTWSAKYDLPSGGIPSTDLSSAVQTSLGKAETAIQDVSDKQDIIQYSTMPTADSTTVGKIVQYTGTTTQDYTNGYFYIGTTDGESVPTYSWENIEVQAGGGGGASIYKLEANEGESASNPFILEEHTEGIYYTTTGYSKIYVKARRTDTAIINMLVLFGNHSVTMFYYNGKYSYEYSGVLVKMFLPSKIEIAGNDSNTFFQITDGTIYKSSNSYTIRLLDSSSTGDNNFIVSNVDLVNKPRAINAKKTFNILPESSITPTTANQLTNKSYVDNAISNAVGSINTVLATLTTPSSNGGE